MLLRWHLERNVQHDRRTATRSARRRSVNTGGEHSCADVVSAWAKDALCVPKPVCTPWVVVNALLFGAVEWSVRRQLPLEILNRIRQTHMVGIEDRPPMVPQELCSKPRHWHRYSWCHRQACPLVEFHHALTSQHKPPATNAIRGIAASHASTGRHTCPSWLRMCIVPFCDSGN